MKTLKDFLSSRSVIDEPVKEQVEDSIQVLEASDLPDFVAEGTKDNSHPMDPPAVLIMRRKAIRQYPHGQRVALYYVDKLNKYVTVPYIALDVPNVKEEVSGYEKLCLVVEQKNINEQTKQSIFTTYNRLNNENKEKFVQWAQENFNDMLDFVKSNTK